MTITRYGLLFALLLGGEPVMSQEGTPVPAAETAAAVEVPQLEEAPADTGIETDASVPAVEDTSAASGFAAEPAPPAADPVPATPSISQEPVPAPVSGATAPQLPVNDDSTRNTLMMALAAVLALTLILIVALLVKRSRDARRGVRQYVAEAYLRDVGGNTAQAMYKLGTKPVMMGRVGGKDLEFLDYIVIPSATIGRRHALIEFKDFGYWIMDQGSINGTFVNNRPVSSEVRLKHGDRIRLHKVEFEFVMPEVGDSNVTVLAPDAPVAAAAAAAAARGAGAMPDFVLEMDEEAPPASAASGPGADDDDLEDLRERMESDEATLLPAAGAGKGGAPAGDDETLMPAGGSGGSVADETLLPGVGTSGQSSGSNEKKKGDEFFDITGGD